MRSRILQCALGALLLSGVPATAFAQSAFTDVTAIAGIDSAHVSNASEEFSMMNFGTGAAWFDADLDGDLDLYMTRRDAGNVLWRQNTDGTFSDIAGTVGLRLSGHDGSAVAVADFNNDGYPDLFVGGHQEDHLFIGSGTGTFSDVTSSAGLAGNQG
ncbi:MAG: VCBS repeat-containing protein, partial [Bacteroidota bacterium]